MKKKIAVMIYVNKNGLDGIRVESRDLVAIELISESLTEIGLAFKCSPGQIFFSKYNLNQLYQCLMKTHSLIDWKISGGLLESIKSLMPASSVPSDWLLNNVVESSLLKPKKHQIEGINSIIRCKKKSFFLNDDFRTGKTIQVILAAKFLQKTHGTVAILCPPYLVRQWKEEISRTCPELDYRIYSFNKSKVKEKIIIVDEIHLVIGTLKRKNNIRLNCRNAEKVIALSGVDFDQNEDDFQTILSVIGLDISKKIIKNNFGTGVKDLINKIPEIADCYLRRSREKLAIESIKKTISLEPESSLIKATMGLVKESDFPASRLLKTLEVSSLMKIKDVLNYIADIRRCNKDCTVAIFSQFPKVLGILKDRIGGAVIFNGEEQDANTKLYQSSIYKSGVSVVCDFFIIMDPLLDSTSNIQMEARPVSGVVTKLLYKNGIDEIIEQNTKYASVKRNLSTIKIALDQQKLISK